MNAPDIAQSQMPSPAGGGPLIAYRSLIASGSLLQDDAQGLAAERLQDLWAKLRGYDPPLQVENAGLLSRLLRRRPTEGAPEDRPGGLYLVGDVGRGKSMLMDLFFAEAQVLRKRRVHFHQFMQDAHARLHLWKQEKGDAGDPIPPLADAIAAEAALLCFDEFQVNDIVDAMILARLFRALFDRDVVVIATSNTPPDDLFRGKPGRDAFLPFIALLKERLDVLVLQGERDWRRQRLRGVTTWLVPADGRAERALDAAFLDLTGGEPGSASALQVLGRRLAVPQAAVGVARFDFSALCGQPLGAGDYLTLATHFHAIVLDGVPRLSPANYDEARRFIVLIDALYDHRVKLVASAEATIDRLYPRGEGADAFVRTASRLEEMQSPDYIRLAHLT